MNTKRMMRWVIVLFLLATLPVMTAVMAQEQEPANQLPVVTEPGESQAPETYNKYESESNNTRGTADMMNVGDVMGGKIGYAGDVDYFRFEVFSSMPILIDIEAHSIGSTLNSVVCLYGQDGSVIGCNNDTDTADSLLYHRTESYGGGGSIYYIGVTHYTGGSGGNGYNYELILSNPLLISAEAKNLGTGNVAGIPFQSQDILAWSALNTGGEKWVMFFDGSDVGVSKNLWNVSATDQTNENIGDLDRILIGFPVNLSLPGLGTVTPWDVVYFDPVRYGPTTEGTFLMYSRGQSHSLTTSAEKIDAVSQVSGMRLGAYCMQGEISTVGSGSAPGSFSWRDEDLACMWPDQDGGSFDGSIVPGLGAEDVIAVSSETFGSYRYYMTILGTGRIGGVNVSQKDIFAITNGSFAGVVWHGPDHGWNYNIDAIEYSGH